MKVNFNINIERNYNLYGKNNSGTKGYFYNSITQKPDIVAYSKISFGESSNVKPKRTINIENEKNKLLIHFNDILKTDTASWNADDMIIGTISKALSFFRAKLTRMEEIPRECKRVMNDKTLNPQQKYSSINALKKEMRALAKINITIDPPKPPEPDNVRRKRIDYPLINKFKSAICEDNFNLAGVFKKHYSGLNEIQTVEELQKKYSQIKFPKRAENVIAKKFTDTLTRDFFETMNDFDQQNNTGKMYLLTDNKIKVMTADIAKKYRIDENVLYQKLAGTIHKAVSDKYKNIITESGISSVPETRKIKTPVITDNDINLLFVDYDDFVLSVLRKHYLGFDKLNEITYSDSNITIPISRLKEPEYRFEKISERIKKFISSAKIIQDAQRDYESFDIEHLKSCLESFLNNDAANNERLLKHIIDFDSCAFEKEDVEQLIKFLRLLDEIKDGNKTCESVLEIIQNEDIRPKGTDRLNEIERKKSEYKLKLQQKNTNELNHLKQKFDKSMDILYINEMNNAASICAKYRPDSLASDVCEKAEFITKLISDNSSIVNGIPCINKSKIENSIMRWDIYNYYATKDSNKPIFQMAVEFSKRPDGSINPDLAGHYLINSEIVEYYPESLELVRNPDVLSLIMDKTSKVPHNAVEYLCKFDNYQDLESNDKTYISKFINMFNLKDPVEKLILKYIIENEYIKVDTSKLAKSREEAKELVPVTISAAAKQDILSKYQYPSCLKYLEGFEDALSSFAVAKDRSGIKKILNNKKCEYFAELKIAGYNDRLMCCDKDYYFDVFLENGLH